MITKRLKVLSKRKGKNGKFSDQYWDEFFLKCRPTQREFAKYVYGVLLTSDLFYRMVESIVLKHTSGGK